MNFEVNLCNIEGVKILTPKRYFDKRGMFLEFFNKRDFEKLGIPTEFVQGNHSRSSKRVIRGFHYQWSPPSGKLIRVTQSDAFMVAIDIRYESPTFGQNVGLIMSEWNGKMLWVPEGFATGFCTLGNNVDVQYLMTAEYDPETQGVIAWNDPVLAVKWPLNYFTDVPIISEKDQNGISFIEYTQKRK